MCSIGCERRIVSSVTVKTRSSYAFISAVSNIFQHKCATHQFDFIDNSNNRKDSLDLKRPGKNLLRNSFLSSPNNFLSRKLKKREAVTSSDEISCGSSIQKFDQAYSKKEMKIDSSEEISTDFVNENDTQQSPSYSIKKTKIIFMLMSFWSLLHSLLLKSLMTLRLGWK